MIWYSMQNVLRAQRPIRVHRQLDLRYVLADPKIFAATTKFDDIVTLTHAVCDVFDLVTLDEDAVQAVLSDVEIIWTEVITYQIERWPQHRQIFDKFVDGGHLCKDLLLPELYKALVVVREDLKKAWG